MRVSDARDAGSGWHTKRDFPRFVLRTDCAYLSWMNSTRQGRLLFTLCAVTLCAACGGSAITSEGSVGGASAGSSGAGGGTAAGECSGDPITFKLLVAPGDSTNYCVATTSYTCGLGSWLSVRNAAGTYLPQAVGACIGSCDPCSEVACSNLCVEPERIGSDGVTGIFDGSYFVSKTCGSGTSCADPACAPPGNYVAELCGAVDTGTLEPVCSNVSVGSAQACVEVPFTWPPASSGTLLQATISASPGG
jgi:hypothetical protein